MATDKYLVFDQAGLPCSEIELEHLISSDAGVFESMCVHNSAIFREKEHLKRLYESAKSTQLELPIATKDLQKSLKKALKNYQSLAKDNGETLFIRLAIFSTKVFIVVGKKKHAAELYQKGVSLKTTVVRRPFVNAAAPQAKTHAYHTGVWAALQPSQNTYEWLFLDREGFVMEVSIGNIFLIVGKQVLTPRPSGILNGVTRCFVIECALQLGFQVVERPLTRHEVFNADEVFLTNTSWEMLPVCELDGRKIGREIPGKCTRQIHQQFKKKVKQECHRQKFVARS